jgi:hypothetical protein
MSSSFYVVLFTVDTDLTMGRSLPKNLKEFILPKLILNWKRSEELIRES